MPPVLNAMKAGFLALILSSTGGMTWAAVSTHETPTTAPPITPVYCVLYDPSVLAPLFSGTCSTIGAHKLSASLQ